MFTCTDKIFTKELLAFTEKSKSLIEAPMCFADLPNSHNLHQLVNTCVNLRYLEGINLYFKVFGLMNVPAVYDHSH